MLDVDPASRGEWTAGFRVWGEGSYTLLLSAVSHDPQAVGTPLGARLQVKFWKDRPDVGMAASSTTR